MFIIYTFLILLNIYLVKAKSVKQEIRLIVFTITAIIVVLTVLFEVL